MHMNLDQLHKIDMDRGLQSIKNGWSLSIPWVFFVCCFHHPLSSFRVPELLLGAKKYFTAVNMWSVGCIMVELLAKEPLFKGTSEIDQFRKIIDTLGVPNDKIWPEFSELPGVKANYSKQLGSCYQLGCSPCATTLNMVRLRGGS
ncbi:hypothetical protein GQ457_16G006940 [Hibiscus cannabinus]